MQNYPVPIFEVCGMSSNQRGCLILMRFGPDPCLPPGLGLDHTLHLQSALVFTQPCPKALVIRGQGLLCGHNVTKQIGLVLPGIFSFKRHSNLLTHHKKRTGVGHFGFDC